jgi:hypothetical protein
MTRTPFTESEIRAAEIEAAREEGFRAGIEMAAAKCEWFARQNADIGADYQCGRVHAGEALAAHIRAIESAAKELR